MGENISISIMGLNLKKHKDKHFNIYLENL
jgi:hypothetical protein